MACASGALLRRYTCWRHHVRGSSHLRAAGCLHIIRRAACVRALHWSISRVPPPTNQSVLCHHHPVVTCASSKQELVPSWYAAFKVDAEVSARIVAATWTIDICSRQMIGGLMCVPRCATNKCPTGAYLITAAWSPRGDKHHED